MQSTGDILTRLGLPALREPGSPDSALRPAADAPRPEGCWCGGDGGRDAVVATIWRPREPDDIVGDDRGVPIVDPEARRVWRVTCPACPEGEAARDYRESILAELREELALRWEQGWRKVGIPEEFTGFRLESSPIRETMPDVVRRLGDTGGPDWGGWWYLWGEYSIGKTGLAVGYAWVWMHHERRGLRFTTATALLKEIQATYGRKRDDGLPAEADVVTFYSTVPLLVVDEIGREYLSGSGWAESKLGEILGHRHAAGLTTVLTSNRDLPDLAERLGDQGEYIGWRIRERCGKGSRVIEVKGKNQRL